MYAECGRRGRSRSRSQRRSRSRAALYIMLHQVSYYHTHRGVRVLEGCVAHVSYAHMHHRETKYHVRPAVSTRAGNRRAGRGARSTPRAGGRGAAPYHEPPPAVRPGGPTEGRRAPGVRFILTYIWINILKNCRSS